MCLPTHPFDPSAFEQSSVHKPAPSQPTQQHQPDSLRVLSSPQFLADQVVVTQSLYVQHCHAIMKCSKQV